MITVNQEMELRTTTGPTPEYGAIAFARDTQRHYLGDGTQWREQGMGLTDTIRAALRSDDPAASTQIETGTVRMERILFHLYERSTEGKSGRAVWQFVDDIVEGRV